MDRFVTRGKRKHLDDDDGDGVDVANNGKENAADVVILPAAATAAATTSQALSAGSSAVGSQPRSRKRRRREADDAENTAMDASEDVEMSYAAIAAEPLRERIFSDAKLSILGQDLAKLNAQQEDLRGRHNEIRRQLAAVKEMRDKAAQMYDDLERNVRIERAVCSGRVVDVPEPSGQAMHLALYHGKYEVACAIARMAATKRTALYVREALIVNEIFRSLVDFAATALRPALELKAVGKTSSKASRKQQQKQQQKQQLKQQEDAKKREFILRRLTVVRDCFDSAPAGTAADAVKEYTEGSPTLGGSGTGRRCRALRNATWALVAENRATLALKLFDSTMQHIRGEALQAWRPAAPPFAAIAKATSVLRRDVQAQLDLLYGCECTLTEIVLMAGQFPDLDERFWNRATRSATPKTTDKAQRPATTAADSRSSSSSGKTTSAAVPFNVYYESVDLGAVLEAYTLCERNPLYGSLKWPSVFERLSKWIDSDERRAFGAINELSWRAPPELAFLILSARPGVADEAMETKAVAAAEATGFFRSLQLLRQGADGLIQIAPSGGGFVRATKGHLALTSHEQQELLLKMSWFVRSRDKVTLNAILDHFPIARTPKDALTPQKVYKAAVERMHRGAAGLREQISRTVRTLPPGVLNLVMAYIWEPPPAPLPTPAPS